MILSGALSESGSLWEVQVDSRFTGRSTLGFYLFTDDSLKRFERICRVADGAVLLYLCCRDRKSKGAVFYKFLYDGHIMYQAPMNLKWMHKKC